MGQELPNKIRIPRLQRDYVQGLDPSVIIPFVEALLGKADIHLNYIYMDRNLLQRWASNPWTANSVLPRFGCFVCACQRWPDVHSSMYCHIQPANMPTISADAS